jgi:hypothetical protein
MVLQSHTRLWFFTWFSSAVCRSMPQNLRPPAVFCGAGLLYPHDVLVNFLDSVSFSCCLIRSSPWWRLALCVRKPLRGSRSCSWAAGSKAQVFLVFGVLPWWFFKHGCKLFGEMCERQWITLFVWFWLPKACTWLCLLWLVFSLCVCFLNLIWGSITYL